MLRLLVVLSVLTFIVLSVQSTSAVPDAQCVYKNVSFSQGAAICGSNIVQTCGISNGFVAWKNNGVICNNNTVM